LGTGFGLFCEFYDSAIGTQAIGEAMKTEPKTRLWRRAALVCRNEFDRVLLVREGDDPYWILPGGQLEEDETFMVASIREVREELNVTARAEDLQFRFCFENYFELSGNGHVPSSGVRSSCNHFAHAT